MAVFTTAHQKHSPKQVLLGMTRGADGVITCAMAVYTVIFLLWVAFRWGGTDLRRILNDTGSLVPAVAVIWMAFRAATRKDVDRRTSTAWKIISLACLCLVAGDIIWLAYTIVMRNRPSPSLADLAHLAFFPVMLVGILSFPGSYKSKADQLKFWMDVATVVIGAGMVLWYMILYPIVLAQHPSGISAALSLAYPLADLVLLVGIASVALDRNAIGNRWALGVLVAGLCFFFLADIGNSYISLQTKYRGGDWPDAFWMLALFAMFIAARYQSWAGPAESLPLISGQAPPHTGLSPLPYMAMVMGYGLLLSDSVIGNGAPSRMSGLVVGAGALTLIVIGRQVMAIKENSRLMAERIAFASQERFHSLVQNSADLISVLTAQGTIAYQSPSIQKVLGYRTDETIGNSIFSYLSTSDTPTAQAMLMEALSAPGKNVAAEFRLRHANGGWVHMETIGINLLHDPNVRGILFNSRDITVRKALEERLKHQAFHEPLTGLPNRTLFIDRLKHALIRAKVANGTLAVMFLDLDNFKLVNDSLGHKLGDLLLIEVGRQLQVCLRSEDTVARLGGDEFAILIEGVESVAEAATLAGRISEVLKAPFNLEGHEVFISSSIGIVLSRGGMDRPDDLLRKADVAMFDAKGRGKSRYALFDPGMTSRSTERLRLETELRRAVERQEFEVYYQPVIDMRTGRISEVEALVRWRHPARGIVPPSQFIPLAEETGLIVPLGLWVLKKACRQVRLWQVGIPGAESLTLSANLSARQLQQPTLIEDLRGALQDSNLAPYRLKLEITESVAMDDAESAALLLQKLKDLGIKLAIDDFGTGYSTLSYLKRYSVDTLKIDGSLIRGIAQSAEDMAIVRAAIAFAKALNLTVTAEGIETEEQMIRLKNQGCDHGQGFYFAKPLTAKDLTARLKTDTQHKMWGTLPLRDLPSALTRPLTTGMLSSGSLNRGSSQK